MKNVNEKPLFDNIVQVFSATTIYAPFPQSRLGLKSINAKGVRVEKFALVGFTAVLNQGFESGKYFIICLYHLNKTNENTKKVEK